VSEDRTQEASPRRRQEARDRGRVAQSPELTAAAGLLAATAALAVWGDGLATALAEAVRDPLVTAIPVSGDAAAEAVARVRRLAWALARPLGPVVGAFALAALAAQQAQVGGLWTPSRLAPDPTRLWTLNGGAGLTERAGRGLWSLAKAAVVAAVAAWVVRGDWPACRRLGELDPSHLAHAAGAALRHLALALGGATLALGLVDFGLQRARLEAALRLTPDEHREDLRAAEGDPALRGRRRQLARSMRGDPAELLADAAVVFTGAGGLSIPLAGGPPPRPVAVLGLAKGPAGERLRRAARSEGIPIVEAPGLTARLARRTPPTQPPSPDLLAALGPFWPR